MEFKRRIPLIQFTILTILLASGCGSSDSPSKDPVTEQNAEQALGKKLFFDSSLSSEGNQSCADCHSPASGFADPAVSSSTPISEGSVTNAFGNRNAPTASYAKFIPDFSKVSTETLDGTTSNYQGGQFLDGRAVDLVEQAKGPFLNPVEMNNTDEADVVNKVKLASYADDFMDIYGDNAFDNISEAYNNIATAIAAFEKSTELNPFSSKFDAWREDKATLTVSEKRGFELFRGTKAKCANCHTINHPPTGSLFTDFNYFNIGVQANIGDDPTHPNNPVYIENPNFIDGGLGDSPVFDAITEPAEKTSIKTAEKGKFRTPTLRNIAETAPYMHNGVYQTLEEVIRHYDITVADYLDPETQTLFFKPEVDANIAEELKTALGLTVQDYDDLEAFMQTLSDGFIR